jgi:hypothetical protein
MLCGCSVTTVGGERLPSFPINSAFACLVFSHLSLFSTACFLSSTCISTMGTMGKKCKREPTPPSEDFGDSEYSEEEFSSESEGSLAPIPLRESSDDSDDSQGLAAEVWTYIRVVERSGLEGSDESEYSSDESEYSSDEEDSDGGGEDEDDDDDDEDGGGGDSDGSGRGDGSKDGDGGGSRGGSGGGGSSRGSTRGGSGGGSNRGSTRGGSGGGSNRASG